MKVPDDLYGSWEFGEYGGRTAATEACWARSGEIVKVLQLKPTAEQAIDLIEHAAYSPVLDVMREVLRKAKGCALNAGDPPSSRAVERLIEFSSLDHFGYSSVDRGKEIADCLELLLDSGAQWRPAEKQISSIRRNLLKQSSRYVVRILRLLLYTPGATDRRLLIELCHSPVMRIKISECDKQLLKDLDAIKQSLPNHRP